MAFPVRLRKFNFYSFSVESNSKGKLLPPQTEALQRLQRFFDREQGQEPGSIALISMPTGSGKSGVISCLPYFLGQTGLKPPFPLDASPYGEPRHTFDKPVLVIAPDLNIAEQLQEVLLVSPGGQGENFLQRRGIVPRGDRARDILPWGTKIQQTAQVRNPEFLARNDVVIANAQKFLTGDWENPNILPDDIFQLVIVDEAHHHPARTWRRIIKKFKNHAMVVFFTATPFRSDGTRVLEEEDGEMVFHLTLRDAREKRIIRRIRWDQLRTDDRNVADIFALILERVKQIQQRKDGETPLPGDIPHMVIAIAKNIPEADQVVAIAREFFYTPESVAAYHSDLPTQTKQATMTSIRSNRIKLLVVVSMLLEGFDHPPISIAAIMTRIVSPVKFGQFIGRAQRVVHGQAGLESEDIVADIVTHTQFQQGENYQAFEAETLIPDD